MVNHGIWIILLLTSNNNYVLAFIVEFEFVEEWISWRMNLFWLNADWILYTYTNYGQYYINYGQYYKNIAHLNKFVLLIIEYVHIVGKN